MLEAPPKPQFSSIALATRDPDRGGGFGDRIRNPG
jgi:hypothetical protein